MKYSPFLLVLTVAAAEFSTYVGDENTWRISKLIVDASGNTYVAGSRTFNLSPNPLLFDLRTEAVVVKLDTAGKRLLFVNVGGKGNDVANSVAVDRAGNMYLAGSTTSPNFPLRNALYPSLDPPETLGFVTKLTSDGSIVYSTYFPSIIQDITVDADGAVYLTGTTYRGDFPTTPGLPKGGALGFPRAYGAFITKIAPAGDKVVYSAVISGSNKPCGCCSSCFTSPRGAMGIAVAVDGSGNAYFAGNSDVTDLPTTPGVLTPTGSGAFVAKVNAAGAALAYLTYIGSGGFTLSPNFTTANRASALAVDAAGNAFVAGSTWDDKLPFANGYHEGAFPMTNDAFAMKLNPTGTALVWGRYLGGAALDDAASATLDAAGNFWVAGETRSTEFPNADGWSTGESYIVRFDARGELSYSGRYPTGTVGPIAAEALLRVATPGAVVHAIAASPRPAVRPWTVGPLGGQVAPGEVVEIKGPHIGGPGALVSIDNMPTEILYSADQQINAIVPFEITGRKTVRIQVNHGPEFVSGVLPAIPQIFAVTNPDGTLNTSDNPAAAGSIMTAWVTGSGYREFPGSLYTIGGQVIAKVYEGGYQINFIAPDATGIRLTSGNAVSVPFPIYVVP